MSVAFRLALILSCCLSNFRSSLRWYCSFSPLIMTLQSESVRNLHFQEFLYTTRYFLVFQDGINAESVVTIKQTCLVFICFRHYQHPSVPNEYSSRHTKLYIYLVVIIRSYFYFFISF